MFLSIYQMSTWAHLLLTDRLSATLPCQLGNYCYYLAMSLLKQYGMLWFLLINILLGLFQMLYALLNRSDLQCFSE